jgi:hypothetical protein
MDDRLQAILAFPAELLDYQRWLDAQRAKPRGARDYLFSEDKPRFEPRRGDVVRALAGLEVSKRKKGARLAAAALAVSIDVDVAPRDAERLLAAIDGERCLLEVRFVAGVSQEVLARFLRATFGSVVLAPAAVSQLDAALSGVEIVRFAAPPYCIERAYWENMIDVRRHIERAGVPQDDEAFVRFMRELHVIALLGARGDSFYKPASPVSDRTVSPGAFYRDAVHLKQTPIGMLFLDGPRVKMPLLGGEPYHRLLCRGLGDEQALDGACRLAGDLDWGRVVTARSERDDDFAAWFCPPRPMLPAHFGALREAYVAARAGAEDALTQLAHFHQYWVRLHPFHCANQSVAMNLVNAVLNETHGAGIPHLILDHLALRLSRAAYAEAFRRAVAAFAVVEADSGVRLAELLLRKHRSHALIHRIADGGSIDDDDAARWALLKG